MFSIPSKKAVLGRAVHEIIEDLTAALAEFEAVATALEEQLGTADVDADALTAGRPKASHHEELRVLRWT